MFQTGAGKVKGLMDNAAEWGARRVDEVSKLTKGIAKKVTDDALALVAGMKKFGDEVAGGFKKATSPNAGFVLDGIGRVDGFVDDIADVADETIVMSKVGTSGSGSIIDDAMKEKILFGQKKFPDKNNVIGGHSPNILDDSDYTIVDIMQENADGTKRIKFKKQFPDGSVGKTKTSTVFPDSWTDDAIIDAVKKVGDSPSIGMRDGISLHRGIVNGVEIEVMKQGDTVISGFPTGGVHTTGFN